MYRTEQEAAAYRRQEMPFSEAEDHAPVAAEIVTPVRRPKFAANDIRAIGTSDSSSERLAKDLGVRNSLTGAIRRRELCLDID